MSGDKGTRRRIETDADQSVHYQWRGDASDAEFFALTEAHGGRPEAGWWDKSRPHCLGWVTARLPAGDLIGFVNVAWDGADHAFVLNTKVARAYQRRGIATELVAVAVRNARTAGCEWLHVDFTDDLIPFYFGACGFRPTTAGLIYLY